MNFDMNLQPCSCDRSDAVLSKKILQLWCDDWSLRLKNSSVVLMIDVLDTDNLLLYVHSIY
jgi:hypothetical protein